MTEPLTKQQQKLVEENHNLIYDFAYRKNLPIDEYYDILAIGLCMAAKIYDENKGKFSSIANCCMKNEVGMYWNHIKRKSSVPSEATISFDAPVYDDKNVSEYVIGYASHDTTYDNVLSSLIVEELNELLTEKEKMVVKFLVKGLTQKEIGKKMNCKQQAICYHVQKISSKFTNYLNKYN